MTEKSAWKLNGFLMLFLAVFVLAAAVCSFILGYILPGVLFTLFSMIVFSGITIVQPNQAGVVIFFGSYMGSIRDSGFFLTVPFANRNKVSLRVSNFNSKTLKVNDVEGNPIEIAAVVVFKVVDSARAMFDVDNYEQFVEIQSETALRHVATKYPYDDFGEGGISLRGNAEEVAHELSRELQERLEVAGVEVIEARLTHLAYATEIASAMLQRQQASAIIAARQKIVEGAVGMAQMAIAQLQQEGIVELDEERKVAMINNLLVAIISERGAQPIINTSSIY
ncbi:SPFH domain-containing protein [Syntrophomonas palmitatica]|uniref:SPFH domain-containing protein n=1 Tax=Syntrophomonas palmitatica TaxID=402877 RepID=UPI0006D127B6|nr:SPFH domain-containing protein [Syntrophomonas palmitatica]